MVRVPATSPPVPGSNLPTVLSEGRQITLVYCNTIKLKITIVGLKIKKNELSRRKQISELYR